MTHIEETGEFTQDDHNELLKRIAMTTEEMNRVIAVYYGFEEGWWMPHEKKQKTFCNWGGDDKRIYYLKEFKFHYDWTALMPVWQKLRGELLTIENLENNKDGYDKWLDKAILFGKSRAYIQSVEKAIAQDTDITTAHRLMVEAIELIKK